MPTLPKQGQISKAELFEVMLDTGKTVVLHCDPRVEETTVPPPLTKVFPLRLSYARSFNFPLFKTSKEGVEALFPSSEGDEWYYTNIPWPAVFALSFDESGQGYVFSGTLPPEYEIIREGDGFRVIDSEKDGKGEGKARKASCSQSPSPSPHLFLISTSEEEDAQ